MNNESLIQSLEQDVKDIKSSIKSKEKNMSKLQREITEQRRELRSTEIFLSKKKGTYKPSKVVQKPKTELKQEI